ncbi:fimbrial protein [Ralstonia sp. UBA689]|uniref:fimbrial protein n=1 Tax=Ralstonia sp. UBA689 TaxID=1947373 RepID=UPI0025EBE1B8|nr:fimbrial protein [Ralstonia sp. UBA689]
MPANLTVPRNTPIGGAFLEYELTAPYQARWRCSGNFKNGIENLVGRSASPERMTDFPIGDTGLAWSIASPSGTEYPDISKGEVSVGGDRNYYYFKEGPGYILKIKKIGQIKEGAQISAGLLGRYSVEHQLYPITIRALRGSTIGTGSCKTPDVTVKMGDQNNAGRFNGVGSSLEPVSFSIALRECSKDMIRMGYQLKPNTRVVDDARSVVALDPESTAKGIGLQLLDKDGKPLPLSRWNAFWGYDKQGGDFDIPLKAAYYQTSPEISAGTANTSVTFVMSYN